MQASKQQYGAKSVTLAYQTLAEEKRREDIYRFRGPSSFSPSESPNEQSASKLETKSSASKCKLKSEKIFSYDYWSWMKLASIAHIFWNLQLPPGWHDVNFHLYLSVSL